MARLFVRTWTMDGMRTSAIPVRILRNAPHPIAIPTYNPNAYGMSSTSSAAPSGESPNICAQTGAM
eukprot:COSAG04_NODE_7878_length_1053_cov_1.096436_1_plen_66_part_00